MSRLHLILCAVALAIALAAPLGNAWKAQHDRKSYPVVRIPVEPYDPRDLLKGHYLTFRIDWSLPADAQPACAASSCCLCLGEGTDNPAATLISCPPAGTVSESCAHVLTGTYRGQDNYDIGINRYYVDETLALPLERLFRDKGEQFSIGLSLRPDGSAAVENLYVGGQPLSGYVAEQGGQLR